MKKVLTEMYDDENPRDLVDKITVCLLYYGLLRRTESITLQVKYIDLKSSNEIDVVYPYRTKKVL